MDNHLRLLHATWPLLRSGTVVSHITAAALHGIPFWAAPLDRLTVTRPRATRASTSRHVTARPGQLEGSEVTTIAGFPVTSLARTVADLAAVANHEEAVAAVDHALRSGVTREALATYVDQRLGMKQSLALRAAVEFGDERAESAGESRSRVVLARLGLPRPDLQRTIVDPSTGQLVARLDFVWDAERIAGEFDGKVKYTGRFGRTPADEVMREKNRDAALRALGWKVIHWVWADLAQPDRILALWRAELGPRS